MLFKTFSAAVFGIDAYLVEVEVDVGPAIEGDFNVVGLPDIAVKESRERIKAALRNCGFDFPSRQAVTVNLAPADIRKEGSAFDLPMALGLWAAREPSSARFSIRTFFSASFRSMAACARCAARFPRRWRRANAASRTWWCRKPMRGKPRWSKASNVFAREIAAAGRGPDQRAGIVPARLPWTLAKCWPKPANIAVDLRDVRGQMAAKRALEVACAGSHNIL